MEHDTGKFVRNLTITDKVIVDGKLYISRKFIVFGIFHILHDHILNIT